MITINDNESQLKAEAIAARRAARPAWQNAHVDRINREREARETAREYRRAHWATGKQCSSCAQTLPLVSFSPAFRDRPTARCKPCVAAATRDRYHRDLDKACSRTRNRPPKVERPRSIKPRKPKPQGPTAEQLQRKAERQREAVERIAHLTSLLMGTIPGVRISSEEGWNVATAELQSLWLLSGDKECVSCKAVVPPTAMRPPGTANFYPGQCRSCARASYESNCIRVFGKLSGPRLIPMRDGTSITIAEFARRHREREQGRPFKPSGADHPGPTGNR